jgi:hypothetical protein
MMTGLLSIIVLAVLFVIFGLLRPRAKCGSACDLCERREKCLK